ncbi:MAG: hypothetical protein WAK67_17380, partial [Xanthobacteraceae bacterium]
PPKADIPERQLDVCFGPKRDKVHCSNQSPVGDEKRFAPQARPTDRRLRECEQIRLYGEVERPCSFEIGQEIEFSRLLDW